MLIILLRAWFDYTHIAYANALLSFLQTCHWVMLVGYLSHCYLLLAATRQLMFPNIMVYTKSHKAKGEEENKKSDSHSGSNCFSWEIQCNGHGCGPEPGVQSWEDDSTLDRGIQNFAPALLGYEDAQLHRKVTVRLQREKWGKSTSCRLTPPTGLWHRAIKPLWSSREAADCCSQGETWSAFHNTKAWAPREDSQTTPSLCLSPFPSIWLLENIHSL